MQKTYCQKSGIKDSTSQPRVEELPVLGSMAQTLKLSQMDIQSGGVQDHFHQNVLKFGFGDSKNVYETMRLNPTFPQNLPKIGCVDRENGKKVYEKRGKQIFVLKNWRFIIKILCI